MEIDTNYPEDHQPVEMDSDIQSIVESHDQYIRMAFDQCGEPTEPFDAFVKGFVSAMVLVNSIREGGE